MLKENIHQFLNKYDHIIFSMLFLLKHYNTVAILYVVINTIP